MKNIFLFLCIILSINLLSQNPNVRIMTTEGNIDVEVFIKKAPVTATNFLRYVDNGRYNTHATFYRVVRMDNQPLNAVKIEVIQGGFENDSIADARGYAAIIHETTAQTGIAHTSGVISMARNKPGSASSEFFICINNQPELDFGGKRNPDGQGFAAFGKVIKGMDVVKKIQQMKDKQQMLLAPVKIISVKRIR